MKKINHIPDQQSEGEKENNNVDRYQDKVGRWLITCFGNEVASDKTERCFRFTEESLELVQSLGVAKDQVLQLVDYVFNRPLGEPHQEVGGTMVTLAALCFATDLDMDKAAVDEYERILTKIDKVRAKHFSKPKDVLSPIPGNSTPQPILGKSASGETVKQAAVKFSKKSRMMDGGRKNIWQTEGFEAGAQWQQSKSLQVVVEVIEGRANELDDMQSQVEDWQLQEKYNYASDQLRNILTQIKNLK